MAHSIEGRVPFLDHHVVEVLRSQPVSQKNGEVRPSRRAPTFPPTVTAAKISAQFVSN